MKCPVCVEKGLKSLVYPGVCTTTAQGYSSYYDEEGTYHSHDPNYMTKDYTCSNNHSWTVRSLPQCPSCDYGVNQSKTIIHGLKDVNNSGVR